MEPTILSEHDLGRLVQISAEYHVGWENPADVLLGSFYTEGAELTRMTAITTPMTFPLSDNEMDSLCAAWLAYRKAQKDTREAEQEARDHMILDALAIAREHPAIKIEKNRDYYGKEMHGWEVSIPSLGWGHARPVERPSEVLELAQAALQVYRNHHRIPIALPVNRPTTPDDAA